MNESSNLTEKKKHPYAINKKLVSFHVPNEVNKQLQDHLRRMRTTKQKEFEGFFIDACKMIPTAEKMGYNLLAFLNVMLKSYQDNPMFLAVHEVASRNDNKDVEFAYKLLLANLQVIKANKVENLDPEYIDRINEFLQYLNEIIAVGVGNEVREWRKIAASKQ